MLYLLANNYVFMLYLLALLSILGMDDDTDDMIKELMMATATDLVCKGHISEMIAGLEIIKYMSANKRHQLYY